SDRPLRSILANAQHVASLAQDLTGKIVERVHFVGAARLEAKAEGLQLAGKLLSICDLKLNFCFLGHSKKALTAEVAKSKFESAETNSANSYLGSAISAVKSWQQLSKILHGNRSRCVECRLSGLPRENL